MPMEEHTRRIIEAGIRAPSGENAQPWRFRVEQNSIELLDDPKSDTSLYNLRRRGTLIAMGAAIENMTHAANSLGHRVSLESFPQGENDPLVARLSLHENKDKGVRNGGLTRAIGQRTTNRKPYRLDVLKSEDVNALQEAAEVFAESGVGLVRVTDRDAIKRLAIVGSTNERVMLGNRELHAFFFQHLTWTKEEDDRIKRGFYIKTLELPLPIEKLFRAFSFWPLMRVLKSIGFTALVGKGNAQTYASSGEIGLITIPADEPSHYLVAGRLFERLWLTATLRGLALQPLTGTIYLGYAIQEAPTHFSREERARIVRQVGVARELCGQSRIAIMYRIGYPLSPPSARAARFPVESLLV